MSAASLLDAIQPFIATWGDDEDGKSMAVFDSWEQVNAATTVIGVALGGLVELRDHRLFFSYGTPREEARKKLKVLEEIYSDVLVHPEYGVYENSQYGTWTDLDAILEYFCNVASGFSDEYSHCDSCSVLVHTEPEHYGDNERFYIGKEGNLICRKCAINDPQMYLDDYKPTDHCILEPEAFDYALVGTWGDFMGRPDFDPLPIPREKVKLLKGFRPVFYHVSGGLIVAVPKGQAWQARQKITSTT